MCLIKDRQIGLIDELTFECKLCRKIEKISTDLLPNAQNVVNLNTLMVSTVYQHFCSNENIAYISAVFGTSSDRNY